MLTIKIIPMTKDDVPEVEKIEAAAYGEHHWSADSFYGELTNKLAYYYCAINEDEKLLGYLGCWHIIDEAHITNIAIHPDFQGKKIGEALLRRAIDDCYKDEIKYITLEVRAGNEKAKNLYKKYGFDSLGVRKGYYQDNGEDALIMWTENIFWDKFKNNYQKMIKNLESKIKVL